MGGRRAVWHRLAEDDLVEAYHFIGDDSPAAAERLLDAVEAAIALLLANPGAGHIRESRSPGVTDSVRGPSVASRAICCSTAPFRTSSKSSAWFMERATSGACWTIGRDVTLIRQSRWTPPTRIPNAALTARAHQGPDRRRAARRTARDVVNLAARTDATFRDVVGRSTAAGAARGPASLIDRPGPSRCPSLRVRGSLGRPRRCR